MAKPRGFAAMDPAVARALQVKGGKSSRGGGAGYHKKNLAKREQLRAGQLWPSATWKEGK